MLRLEIRLRRHLEPQDPDVKQANILFMKGARSDAFDWLKNIIRAA